MTDDPTSLLRAALRNYRTVRATVQHTFDGRTYRIALEKFQSNPLVTSILEDWKNGGGSVIWRIWVRRPRWWRREESHDGGRTWSMAGGDGDRYWQLYPDGTRMEEEDQSLVRTVWAHEGPQSTYGAAAYDYDSTPLHHIHPRAGELLDPADLLIEDLEIEAVGGDRFLGRPVIRALARLADWDRRDWPEAMSFGPADDYELLIDKETGVVLRFASRVDRREFSVTEMAEIWFDEPLGDDLFESPRVGSSR